MNIAQIKRFVNDSLIPLNRLIGSPEDDTSKNTLFGIQKKMLISGGGGVKHVYRGITSGAGNVTLPAAVNMDKTVVLSVSKGSSGTVALASGVTYFNMPKLYMYNGEGTILRNGGTQAITTLGNYPKIELCPDSQQVYLYGGQTNLTVREYSARLVDENTIYCDGPVEWQVIEYN